ncbi:hypothetical protein C8F01DRAFT_969718, partial [Mycena amicta]
GEKLYERKYPKREHKKARKITKCGVTLCVKVYDGSSQVLGWWKRSHNHDVGTTNLPFTRISKDIRELIAGHVRNGLSTDMILKKLHDGTYSPFVGVATPNTVRKDFIQASDINLIKKRVEAEQIRKHRDDGVSTMMAVDALRWPDAVLFFKSRSDAPPASSDLDLDIFILILQTQWQRTMFEKYGRHLLCVDATHNTT